MAKKALSAKEREVYEAGGIRFDPPSRHRDKIALGELEAAVQALRAWTRRPREIRAALAIPSREALARWRAGDDAVPYSVRERVAIVHALRQRLAESGDFASLKPLPDLKLRGRPSIPGRAVLASGQLSELLALLFQLVLVEEAATRRQRTERKTR